jgi:hypothetical protein
VNTSTFLIVSSLRSEASPPPVRPLQPPSFDVLTSDAAAAEALNPLSAPTPTRILIPSHLPSIASPVDAAALSTLAFEAIDRSDIPLPLQAPLAPQAPVSSHPKRSRTQ